MKSALQRQLDAFGWRAIGFLGALVAVAAGAFLWGLHIEGRVDRVVIQGQHDHRIIERLAEGKPLRPHRQVQIHPNPSKSLDVGEGQAPKEPTGTTGGVQPPKGGSTKPPAPGKGGEHGGTTPTKPSAQNPGPPPSSTTPATTPIPPSAEAATEEARRPANPAASDAPGLIGNPVGAAGELACGAREVVTVVAGVRICPE